MTIKLAHDLENGTDVAHVQPLALVDSKGMGGLDSVFDLHEIFTRG